MPSNINSWLNDATQGKPKQCDLYILQVIFTDYDLINFDHMRFPSPQTTELVPLHPEHGRRSWGPLRCVVSHLPSGISVNGNQLVFCKGSIVSGKSFINNFSLFQVQITSAKTISIKKKTDKWQMFLAIGTNPNSNCSRVLEVSITCSKGSWGKHNMLQIHICTAQAMDWALHATFSRRRGRTREANCKSKVSSNR